MYNALWPHLLRRFLHFRGQRIFPLGQVFSRWITLLATVVFWWHCSYVITAKRHSYLWVGSSFPLILRWQALFEQDMRASEQVCCATMSMLPLILLHQLFQGEFCLQLCGTPYGLFTKGAMAGSWVLLHPPNKLFAERVPAVRQNHWLEHQGITKIRRKTEFSQKRSKGTQESQSEDAKKNKKTASNAGKCH